MSSNSKFALTLGSVALFSLAYLINTGLIDVGFQDSSISSQISGRYHRQSITSTFIILYLDGTFEQCVGSCVPGGEMSTKGQYTRIGDKVTFSYQYDSSGVERQTQDAWFKVKWNDAELLVPEWKMADFCNFYNGLRFSKKLDDTLEPWIGLPYYHNEDIRPCRKGFLPDGSPKLPTPWNGYIQGAPITGEIQSISPSTYSATINLGSANGVYEGCAFYGLRSIFGNEHFTAIKVYPESTLIRPAFSYSMVMDGRHLRDQNLQAGDTIMAKPLEISILEYETLLAKQVSNFRYGMEFTTDISVYSR